jgi:cellulose synthase/poly-beta-1,6-N-acetylglucosamine synthase-like glycosyltransferase
LSKVLLSKGYKIRSLPGSRVKTHYPTTVQVYLRQLSRWFRNRLLLGISYKSWEDVFASLRGGSSAGIILAIPFIGWLKSRFVFSLWSLLSLRAFIQNWIIFAAGRSAGESVWTFKNFRTTLILLPINLLGMLYGLWDSLLPQFRTRW